MKKPATVQEVLLRAFALFFMCLFFSCHNLLVKLIPPDGNTITSFSLPNQTTSQISGTRVAVYMPAGSNVSSVIPHVEASEKAAVIPITWEYIKAVFPSASPETLVKNWIGSANQTEWAIKTLQANPDFVLPILDKPINFGMPVMIAVVSAQGSTKLYTVTVSGGAPIVPTPTDKNKLLSFAVPDQIGNATINHTAPANVAFSIPQSVDVRSLLPTVTVSSNAKPLPLTFEYLRASFPTSDLYDLFLGYYLAADKADFLRQKILNTPDYVELSTVLTLPIDFTNPVPFAVLSWDKQVDVYEITATKVNTDAQLIGFSFPKALNPELVRDATATINEAAKSANLTVWYAAETTAPTTLIPSFNLAAQSVAGTSLRLTSGSGAVITNNTTAVSVSASPLSVFATRTGTATKEYKITVEKKEDPNTIRSITDFRFTTAQNSSLPANAMASIYDSGDTGLITITVPYTTTQPANLKASFVTGGTITNDANVVIANNANIPTPASSTLICTSKDGSKRRVYTLQITFLPVTGSLNPEMQSFKFSALTNAGLAEDAIGRVDNASGTIFVEVKYTTANAPRQLIPEFAANGNVFVDGIMQTTGSTQVDFGFAQTYTVVSPFGASTKNYRVQIAYTAISSSACELYSLKFTRAKNPQLLQDIEAVIDHRTNTIFALFSFGANHKITPLIADITYAGLATKDGTPISGTTASGIFADGSIITVQSGNALYSKTYAFSAQEVGSVIYVNANARGRNTGTSWNDALINLQTALDRPLTPPTEPINIYVANTADYKPALNAQFTLKSYTSLYGGFAGTEANPAERQQWAAAEIDPKDLAKKVDPIKNKTVLRGNGDRVMYSDSNNIVIDGFVFTGGTAQGGVSMAGGLYFFGSGKINVIRNCEFTNNTAGNGGGAHITGTKVYNCAFKDNTSTDWKGGGGAVIIGSTVIDCLFEGNIAKDGDGGGASVDATEIFNCAFINNFALFEGAISLGAVYHRTVMIDNCYFKGNRASANIIGGFFATSYITNSVFENNVITNQKSSLLNISIMGDDVHVIISGCTFTSNVFAGAEGIVFVQIAGGTRHVNNAKISVVNNTFTSNINTARIFWCTLSTPNSQWQVNNTVFVGLNPQTNTGMDTPLIQVYNGSYTHQLP